MRVSNWHTSGRTNKTKDVAATIFSVSDLNGFSIHAVRLGIRTIDPQKVTTANKHKSEIKFCDIVLTMQEAENLLEKLKAAVDKQKEFEAQLKGAK